MFDGLQEGVVVIKGNSLHYMNELSNKIFTEILGLGNFFKNKDISGKKC